MKTIWSKEEDALLIKLCTKVGYKDLVELFPNHTQDALRNRVYQLKKEERNYLVNHELDQPSILIFDIENTPMKVDVWGLKNDYISPTYINEDYILLSWSAKWYGSDKILSDVLTPSEAKRHTDKRISKSLWTLIDMCDILLGHNSVKFDEKKINTRFLINKLSPPRPHKSIDTLRVVRSGFGFSSNKLEYLCSQLEIDHKTDPGGYETWKECRKGNPEALQSMVTYNQNDVRITEELFNELRDWMKIIPSKPKWGWKN